jgi:PAS domain S-box-containing protein
VEDQRTTNTQLKAELAQLRQELAALKVQQPQREEPMGILRSREELFHQAVLSISDHIYVSEITPAGQHINLYISPHAADLTGYPLENFVNDWSFWPLQVIHPDDRAAAAAQARQLAEGYNSEVEYRLVRADGEIIWVRDSGKVRYEARTGTKIIYGVVSDITERKRLETQLSAIYQLGRELNLVRSEKKIFERVLETIAQVLEASYAGYALVNYRAGRLEYRSQQVDGVMKAVNFHLPLTQSEDIGVAVVRQGQAIIIDDTAQDRRYNTSAFPDGSSRSLLTVPIKISEQVIGILSLASVAPHRFKSKDQQVLQTLADQAATAIENARLYREIGQHIEELASMNMISQAITASLELHETLTLITAHVVRLFNASLAALALCDELTGNIWFAAISGDRPHQDTPLAPANDVVAWVIEQGQPLLLPDIAQDERFTAEVGDGLKDYSVLCFPLQTRSETIGAIEVIGKKSEPFVQDDLRLLSWLAMPAVTAIVNARLYEAQRAAREQAEILREASSTLTSTLDLNQVLESILTHLEQVVPYDNACVFLRQDEWLHIVAGRGKQAVQKQLINRFRHPVDHPFYQQIEQTGRPLILKDAQIEPHFSVWGDEADEVRSWMGVPLVARNKVIGYVTIDGQEAAAYDQADAEMAQAFANQAAVAIQNAQLFEQVDIGRKRLQSLSHRLVEIQETERRHIARELHDEAGQTLASLMVGLRLLEKEANNPAAIPVRISELKRATDGVLENLHRLAMDLHPATLDHLGLVATLRQYAESFGAQHDLILQFETVGFDGEQRLGPTIETNLYRIVQEALANVARHAQASQADVLLERRGGKIVIIVEDNGVGFDPETKKLANRLGLLGMRERAEMMGGKLEIESAPGAGTTIYVEIPYEGSDSNC